MIALNKFCITKNLNRITLFLLIILSQVGVKANWQLKQLVLEDVILVNSFNHNTLGPIDASIEMVLVKSFDSVKLGNFTVLYKGTVRIKNLFSQTEDFDSIEYDYAFVVEESEIYRIQGFVINQVNLWLSSPFRYSENNIQSVIENGMLWDGQKRNRVIKLIQRRGKWGLNIQKLSKCNILSAYKLTYSYLLPSEAYYPIKIY
jgi:hypothetical protein